MPDELLSPPVPRPEIRGPLTTLLEYAATTAGTVSSRREQVNAAANEIIEQYAAIHRELTAFRELVQEFNTTTTPNGRRILLMRLQILQKERDQLEEWLRFYSADDVDVDYMLANLRRSMPTGEGAILP